MRSQETAQSGGLDEEDKSTVFKIIDKMLTTEKFKNFFNKNVVML